MPFNPNTVADLIAWWGQSSTITRAAAPATHFTRANSEALTTPSTTQLQTPTSWSLAFYFQLDSLPDFENLVAKWVAPGEEFVAFVTPDAAAAIGISTDGNVGGEVYAVTPNGAVSLNTPHLYIAHYDNTTQTLGVQLDNGTIYTTPTNGPAHKGTRPFTVGYFPAVNYMDGWMQNLMRFQRPLTTAERAALWNDGNFIGADQLGTYSPTILSDIINLWMLDEENGPRADIVAGQNLSTVGNPNVVTGKAPTAVAVVSDQAPGNLYPLVQPTTLRQPMIVGLDRLTFPQNNGYNVFRHLTTNFRYMTADALAARITGDDTPFSLLFVVRYLDASNDYTLWSAGNSGDSSTNWCVFAEDVSAYNIVRRDDIGSEKSGFTGVIPPYSVACIAYTFDGKTGRVYYNGGQAGPFIDLDVGPLDVNQFTIGAFRIDTTAGYLNGDWMEVAVYSRVLSDADVVSLSYQAGQQYNFATVVPANLHNTGVDPMWKGEQLIGGSPALDAVPSNPDLWIAWGDFHAETNQFAQPANLRGAQYSLSLNLLYAGVPIPNGEKLWRMAAHPTENWLAYLSTKNGNTATVWHANAKDTTLTPIWQYTDAMNGTTWQVIDLFVVDENELYVLANHTGGGAINPHEGLWHTTDGGATWSGPFAVAGDATKTGWAIRKMTTGRHKGRIWTAHETYAHGLFFSGASFSDDEGLTWNDDSNALNGVLTYLYEYPVGDDQNIGYGGQFNPGAAGIQNGVDYQNGVLRQSAFAIAGVTLDNVVMGAGFYNTGFIRFVLATTGAWRYNGPWPFYQVANWSLLSGGPTVPGGFYPLPEAHFTTVYPPLDWFILADTAGSDLKLTTDYGFSWQTLTLPGPVHGAAFVGGRE